ALKESDESRSKRRALEGFGLVLENALDAVVTMDAMGRVSAWNAEAARLFGWTPEEALGRELVDLIIPERYAEAHRRGLAHFARTGEGPILRRRIEIEGRRKDGSEVVVELSVTPVALAEGTSFTAFIRDITERRRQAMRLAVEHDVSAILARSPEAPQAVADVLGSMGRGLGWDVAMFWVLDETARTLRCGEAWSAGSAEAESFIQDCRTRGFRLGEGLPGHTAEKKSAAWIEDLERTSSFLRLVPARAAGLRSAFMFPVQDDTRLYGVIELFQRRAASPDSELLEVVGAIGRQLGQFLRRKQHEQALAELNRELERRVDERTARIQEVVQELDAFAYSVAHDLRAPLRAMSGFSQALLEDYAQALDPRGQEFARRVADGAERMNRLIEDLLSYSRLAREDLHPHRIACEQAVDEVLRAMADEIREKNAEVRVERPMPAVLAHGRTLVQALTNLVGNALKFVAPGEPPKLRIRAETAGAVARLWVEDQGIGIPTDQLDRIFRVFERGHPQDKYPGTGVGLAIVRRGIERLGGRVGVESEVGRGSRFWIELPLAR
ncbi:MAG TPA: ATP-binding protein, partial [Planctomycetota bacterium]|nr:ATP-binding protein [Planctomycetota bacterium]